MPRLYVDLDANKLVTGASSTLLAGTPKLYQGDKANLELELLARNNNVLGHYTSAASAIHVRVGTLGGVAVASAASLSSVTLSYLATGTAGLTDPVTATGLVIMSGSTQALASASLNSPVSGSVSVGFSTVQIPSVKAVVEGGQVAYLEVPTCGKNFSTVPCVTISYPDVMIKEVKSSVFALQNGAQNIAPAGTLGPLPENLKLRISYIGYNTAASSSSALYLKTATTYFSIDSFTSANSSNGKTGVYETSDTDILIGPIDIIPVLLGSLGQDIEPSFSFSSSLTKVKTTRASISASIQGGDLQMQITSGGDFYGDAPDVNIVPSNRDFDIGTGVSPSSATVVGRTITVSASSHGLSAGDLILVENMALGTQVHNLNAAGIWKVTQASSGSFSYRISNFLTTGTVSKTLTVTSAKIYPVLLRKLASSVAISSAGSGYAPNSALPFRIESDTCSGLAATGVVTVSNAGTLASASIVCAGAGFTSSSQSVTLPVFKSVQQISVTCAGDGYWDAVPSVTIDNSSLVSTAPGSTPASVSVRLLGNGGVDVALVSSGYGYTAAPTITLAAPNFGNGIRSVAVATSGVGYSDGTFACQVDSAPTGGVNASVKFVKSGTSQGFVIVNPGAGYASTPNLTVADPDLLGQVSGLSVTCAGAGYTFTPLVTLSGGGGSGASAQAIMDNGSVISLSLVNSGSGYTSAPCVSLQAPENSVYYKCALDLSGASVTSLLAGGSSSSAYLQIHEQSGSDQSVLAQIPVTIQARVS